MNSNYIIFKKYIKKIGFDIDIEAYPKVKEAVEQYGNSNDLYGLEHYMNELQNCGGFALQIPTCIFSGDKYTFEEKVLRILELYPFVRLIGDTDLKENEYIVKFRAGITGHHFIKIDEKGNATEKNECNPPRNFKDWGNLEDSPEATFAVVKQDCRTKEEKELPQCNKLLRLDQDIHYLVEEDGYIDVIRKEAKKPLTFIDLLKQSYNKGLQSFTYNEKEFSFIKDSMEPEIIQIYLNNLLVGKFYEIKGEYILDIEESQKNHIYGFQPSKEVKCISKSSELSI